LEEKARLKTGFKRVVNKRSSLPDGYERIFKKCPKCKERFYYDFIPYSLSNPVLWLPCGHDLKRAKEF